MNKNYIPIIVLGMAASGGLQLAWFLSPPNPNRVGYWFINGVVLLPLLALLGLRGFISPADRPFCLPVFFYAATIVCLLQSAPWLPVMEILLQWLSFEQFCAILWMIAVIWLIIAGLRTYRDRWDEWPDD